MSTPPKPYGNTTTIPEGRFLTTAAIAGLLSIAFGTLGGIVDRMWTFPSTTATAAEVLAFANDHRTALFAAMVLNITAVTLWLVFGAGVWVHLRPANREETFLSTCFAVGLISFVTLLFAGFTAACVLLYRAPDVSEARLLYDLAFGLLAMSGLPTALALAGYAALVYRTGRLPRWTALLALVASATHLALLASFFVRDGFFSLEGAVIIVFPATLFVWIAGTSVAMLGPTAAN